MKPTLKTGLAHRFAYKVPENKTVPYTFPESLEIGRASCRERVYLCV